MPRYHVIHAGRIETVVAASQEEARRIAAIRFGVDLSTGEPVARAVEAYKPPPAPRLDHTVHGKPWPPYTFIAQMLVELGGIMPSDAFDAYIAKWCTTLATNDRHFDGDAFSAIAHGAPITDYLVTDWHKHRKAASNKD